MREWICARITDWRFYLFLICTLPAALLVSAILNGDLGANPLETIRDTTGIWTLRFLIFTLAITPLRRFMRWREITRPPPILAPFPFFYSLLHFLTYFLL